MHSFITSSYVHTVVASQQAMPASVISYPTPHHDSMSLYPHSKAWTQSSLQLLRRDHPIVLDFRLVRSVHRGHKLEHRSGRMAREALDDVVVVLNIPSVHRTAAQPSRLSYRDHAPSIFDVFPRSRHNAIRRLLRPAHNNSLVWCSSHGESSEESDDEREECEAHGCGT